MSGTGNVAERFAKALDAEDYVAAEALLSDDCEYTCRGRVYRGPAETIAAYREAGREAKGAFDGARYESAVEEVAEGVAVIEFSDHLCRGGRWFTFRCRQRIEVDGQGRIGRIEHVDLPGQREALAEFVRVTG